MTRGIIALLVCAVVGGCAHRTPDTQWVARDDADLAADLAACTAEAGQIDMRATSTYTDSRYGPAAAMTAQMQGANRRISEDLLYRVARDQCMKARGWVAVE